MNWLTILSIVAAIATIIVASITIGDFLLKLVDKLRKKNKPNQEDEQDKPEQKDK